MYTNCGGCIFYYFFKILSFLLMIVVEINNLEFYVSNNMSVLEACKFVGLTIPRFCYHETLSISGNCRMCLVEINNSPKPVASCALPVSNKMKILSDTPQVKKARENILELLLLNHPLDCPICDQGGECDLQDQIREFGGDHSRFFFDKRGIEDKNCGSRIKTIMTRCIHCTRCVRFGTEIAGVEFLGTLNRGEFTEIGSFLEGLFNSELSGNVIDLCPVGALTSKPYAFKFRPWELRSVESIDVTDSIGSHIYINFKESRISRILPKFNFLSNDNLISDKARFYFDSNRNQRILLPRAKVLNSNTYETITWSQIHENFLKLFKNSKKVLFLVNENSDLKILQTLRLLSYEYKDHIRLKLVDSKKKFTSDSNLNVNWLQTKIIDIQLKSKVCFVFSSNLRFENSLLNCKIRVKFNNSNFFVYSFSSSSLTNSNFSLSIINLNLNVLIFFMEGKLFNLSKIFTVFMSPIFCLGEQQTCRGFNISSIISFLKIINPSSLFFNITISCNEYSNKFLKVSSITSKDIKSANSILAVDLDSLSLNYKFLKNANKQLWWINTHVSENIKLSTFLFPITTEFEEEKYFINMEEKLQQTNVSVRKSTVRSLNKFLLTYLKTQNLQQSKKYFNFYIETLQTPILFDINRNIFTNNVIYLKKNRIDYYPIKNVLEDFYCSNKMTRNSSTMLKCSQETRLLAINFF